MPWSTKPPRPDAEFIRTVRWQAHPTSRSLPSAELPDEAVHLAAGMLMINVGFKSVIGTMWSIYDSSAPIIMGKLYEVLVEQVVSERLQPALALHEATKALRQQYGERDFVRWVPFVHFGL